MSAVHWHDPDHRGFSGFAARWLVAGVLILAAHAGAVYVALHWHRPVAMADPAAAAVMIELAPLPVAPPSEMEEVAPGPQMVQAPEPVPDAPDTVEEAAAPPEPQVMEPLEDLPELPPPSALAEALLPPPRPVEEKIPEPAPKPIEKPKPKKQASRKPAAPATSAAPRSDAAPANAVAAPSSGASASSSTAPATWRSMLVAHLNRHKRYPSEARARQEEGTARLRFSIDRSGRVVGANLVGSSGSSALDAEVLDMIRRASPLPAPPPEVGGGTISLTVPVNFNTR